MKRLLPLLLLAAPALAAEAPRVLPSRDVTIIYQLSGEASRAVPGGVPGALRLSWNAAEQRLRVEPEGRTQVLLVDLDAPRVEVMDSGLRTAMSLPVRRSDLQPLTLQGARFTRRGRATVAGRSCTEYAVQSARGHGTLCLTADGVALRASGEVNGHAGAFTATSVSYEGVAPSLFQVPPGYVQLGIPRTGQPQ